MTIPIDITISWPSTLPLPFIDFSGQADVATLISTEESARIQRRSRQKRTYATVNVTWKLSKTEYTEFLTFWEDTLGSGSAAFSIELRYPKISDLDIWIVKIISDIRVEPIEHEIWVIGATLQLISLASVADAAAVVLNFFYVLDESSSGAPLQQFFVQDESSALAIPEAFAVQEEP